MSMFPRTIQHCLIFALLPCLTSCASFNYYRQSVIGHLQILWQRESIEQTLNHAQLPETTQQTLRHALSARDFASQQLGLPNNDSYKSYADIKRDYVVWNVTAAPALSLLPKQWCYFIVGCVNYRGYYKKQAAENYATELKRNGYDIHVRGVSAYSTLGWFDDPVLSTMIKWSQRQLTGVIFHELAHQMLYIDSDTAFNESYAVATEQLGVLTWLSLTQPKKIEDYLTNIQRKKQFRALLISTRQQLEQLYQSNTSIAEKQQNKSMIFNQLRLHYTALKETWSGYKGFDQWFETPLNNARLIATMTYYKYVPMFITIFKQVDGNWAEFHRATKQLGALSPDKRNEKITELNQNNVSYQAIISLLPTVKNDRLSNVSYDGANPFNQSSHQR